MIDHNLKRIQQHLRIIIDGCGRLSNLDIDNIMRVADIKEAAATALAYIPAPEGEWLDVTTLGEWARGFKREVNSVTGEERRVPITNEKPIEPIVWESIYTGVPYNGNDRERNKIQPDDDQAAESHKSG